MKRKEKKLFQFLLPFQSQIWT